MGKYSGLANKIVQQAGGVENIISVTNCATRLRMYLKDDGKFNKEKMEKIQGVVGVSISGDQYQVIVGQTSSYICKEIQDTFGVASAGEDIKKKRGNLFDMFLATISGCMAPVLPALTASGFIKVILTLLTISGILSVENQTYLILNTASDAVFYFLPVLLAYTAAKQFKCNEILATVIAGLLLHPSFIEMVTNAQNSGGAIKFFGLPVTLAGYSGSVMPIILTVWVMSYLERFIDKHLPKSVIYLFRPVLLVLIMTPVALVITGPIGAILGEWVAVFLNAVFAKAGWVAIAVTLVFTSFLCMTGMHLALIPIAMTSIAQVGYDEFVFVVFLCFTLSQGAVALAVLLKTKNTVLRQIAAPAAMSGLLGGISEPALYGISFKMRKPLYATIIGSTAAGIYAGLVHLKVFAYGLLSLEALPGYYSAKYASNFQHAVITVVIDIAVTMIATWIIGFDDSVYNDTIEDDENGIELKSSEIVSPASGTVVPMEDIQDDVFSTGTVGESIGIISDDAVCYSPVDGVVTTVFQSKHAIGFRNNDGAEILIHVGIDSVKLNGKGFELFVKEGDVVKRGQKVLKYDADLMKKNQIDETTILVVANSNDYQDIKITNKKKTVKAGDSIFSLLV